MRPAATVTRAPCSPLVAPFALLASLALCACADLPDPALVAIAPAPAPEPARGLGAHYGEGPPAMDGGDLSDASADASDDARTDASADVYTGPDSGLYRFTGGTFACSTAPVHTRASPVPFALALLVLAVLSRRRRRIPAAVFPLTVIFTPALSHAQSEHHWAVDRFDPTPAGDLFFASDLPRYAPSDRAYLFRAGLVGDYAWRPLVVRPDGQVPRAVIDHDAIVHAQFSVSFRDRVEANFSLPFTVYESGIASGSGFPSSASGRAAVGDIRLGARVRLFHDAERDAFSLHLAGAVYLNAFERAQGRTTNLSDDSPRARLTAVLAGRSNAFRWSVTTGVHVRAEQVVDTSGTTVGSEWLVTAALGLLASEHLTLGPEAWFSTTFDRAFRAGNVNAEIVLAAHVLAGDSFRVGIAAGPGVVGGVGTPLVRALVQLAYAPGAPSRHVVETVFPLAPLDTDHDGVPDPSDLCANEPRGPRPDPARTGCPARDTDHDGLLDPDDACPAQPPGAHPDPLSAGCPLPDRDGDGVRDADDLCGDVPVGAHADPTRAGCPDGDADHDGVTDHADACRDVPAGVLGDSDASRAGCPLADRDHDLVPDVRDRCPDVPGAPSPDVALDGCNDGLVITNGVVVSRVNPLFTNARLRPGSERVLDALVHLLRTVPGVRLVVDVYAQGRGDPAYALVLAQDRADEVRRHLVARGADGTRVESHGVQRAAGTTANSVPQVEWHLEELR